MKKIHRFYLFVFSLFQVFTINLLYSQLPGSGNSISFSNTFNSPLQLNGSFSNITLPITLATWITIDPNAAPAYYPIFTSHFNSFAPVGIKLYMLRGGGSNYFLYARYGGGLSSGSFREYIVQIPSSLIGVDNWFHISAVYVGVNDIRIYINGNQITNGTYVGPAVNMQINTGSSNGYIGGDINGIGCFFCSFSGKMDHFSLWNRALTQGEIRQFMCQKIPLNSPNLLMHYNFDVVGPGILGYFSQVGAFSATGSAVNQLSGAPIGDTSVYLYGNNWPSTTIALASPNDTIRANFPPSFANPAQQGGIHLYRVNQLPNTLNDITSSSCLSNYYYGHFDAFFGNVNLQGEMEFTNSGGVNQVFNRLRNNSPTWNLNPSSVAIAQGRKITMNTPRREYITRNISAYNPGLDTLYEVCQFPLTLTVPPISSGSLLWSNNATATSINIMAIGTYSLTVFDSLCNTSTVYNFNVTSLPPVPYNPNIPDSVFSCLFPFPLVRSPFPAGIALWSNLSSSDTFFVSAPGNYFLQWTDTCGNQTTTFFNVISVSAGIFNLSVPDTLFKCPGDSVFFSLNLGQQFQIDWSNNQIGSNFGTHLTGQYYVEVRDSCNILNSDTFWVVNSSDYFPPNLVSSPLVLCSDSLEITVNIPPHLTASWPNSTTGNSFFIDSIGSYTYTLTDTCGRIQSYTFLVNESNYFNYITGLLDTLIACEFPFIIQPNPIDNGFFLWPDNSSGPNFSALAEGFYTLIYGDTCGSSFSQEVFVLIADTVTVNFNLSDFVIDECAFPIEIDLPIVAGVVYLWQNGSTSNQFTINNPGTYRVRAFGPCGLIVSDVLRINPRAIPEPDFFQLEWCPGDVYNLFPTFESSTGYSWNTGDSITTITADTVGRFVVEGFDDCELKSTVYRIKEAPNCEIIYIPNSFTPNGDGINDLFLIKASNISDYNLMIYSRWGELVYQSTDSETGWDGIQNNQPLPQGVYQAVLNYRTFRGEAQRKVFSIHLLR